MCGCAVKGGGANLQHDDWEQSLQRDHKAIELVSDPLCIPGPDIVGRERRGARNADESQRGDADLGAAQEVVEQPAAPRH